MLVPLNLSLSLSLFLSLSLLSQVSAASTPVESSEAEAEAETGAEPSSSTPSSSSQQEEGRPSPPSKNQDEALAAARLLEVDVDEAEARGETVAATLGLAVAIGAGLYALKGTETAQAYFAGYLLEQSLSVDNLFVFVLVFRYFGVSGPGQDRVLAWGIASAAVLRLLMVAAGAELIENFKPVLLVFAGILVYSSIKLAFVDGGGDGDEEKEDLSENAIVKICKRILTVSDEYDGVKFFTEVPVVVDGASSSDSETPTTTKKTTKRVATPLLLVLAVIELSDVVFAVDSVPAVFGVSRDPLVVWAASMAAIASLRALYGFVATALGTLRFLDKAVAAVLAWVGGKMIFEFFSGVEVSTALSLGVVVACLAVGVGASLAVGSKEEEEEDEEEEEKEEG